ncbi:MAG: hypothetical protein NZO58_05180, partial [Gemmataceae bacterium]|nr:hypothetical protein [Gemmataceae bacterium]
LAAGDARITFTGKLTRDEVGALLCSADVLLMPSLLYETHSLSVDEALAAGRTSTFRIEDGVSCEACHGPAEHWLAEHFRPAWKKRSAAERAALGMTDLRSPVVRAATCIPCHVGHPGAEVDHDLIAAGHPWLRFDVLAHHGRLHKHWNSAQDALARGGADFARNMRWAGDLAAAEAALRLIARRAEAAPAVWPEFAYQDCRSCHHELSPDGPKPRRNLERLGGPRMNLAQFGPLLSGADHPSAPLDAAQLPLLLGPLQQSLAVWRPERAAVAAHARKAADWLAERRAQASH